MNYNATTISVRLGGREIGFSDNFAARVTDVLMDHGAQSISHSYDSQTHVKEFSTDLVLTEDEAADVIAEARRAFYEQFHRKGA